MSQAPVTVTHTIAARRFRIVGLKVALSMWSIHRAQTVKRHRRELADIDKRIADTRAELKRAETSA